MTAIALIHSPILGPASWEPVAGMLRERGHQVFVPALEANDDYAPPYWQQHVAWALEGLPEKRHFLVGHSGAGPLLPAIGAALPVPPAGYVFVDAGIPEDGLSRLDLLALEVGPGVADSLRDHLEAGGRFPEWRERDLAEAVAMPAVRTKILAMVRSHPLRFMAEPIPVAPGWPEAPCAFLQLSDGYAVPAERARSLGWPVSRCGSGHFDLMTAPETVAGAIVSAIDALSAP